MTSVVGRDYGALDFTFVDNTPVALIVARQTGGLALARAPATGVLVSDLDLLPVPFLNSVSGLQAHYLLRPMAHGVLPAASKLHRFFVEIA